MHKRSPLAVVPIALALAAAAPPASPPADDFVAQVSAHFAAWDRDHDGTLSADEIELALDDPTVRGPAAAAAAVLRRAVRANAKLAPVTVASLSAAMTGAHPPAYEAQYQAAVRKIATTKRDVFADGGPHVATLGQGRLGDCFLLAGVGTMAAVQPDRLRRMIAVQPDGQVAVHLGTGDPVVLPPPTDGEIVIGANAYNTYNDGVWANVMENAIGHVMLGHQRTVRHQTPYSIIGVGGTPNVPLSLMTGHGCRRVGCEDFQKPGKLVGADRATRLEAIRTELESAFKSGRLVVGGTAEIHAGETVVPGLYYDHSYGVLAYDRATDAVTFWNPMGNGYTPKGSPGLEHGYPTSHGRFTVPLPETVMWFGSFSIETADPAR